MGCHLPAGAEGPDGRWLASPTPLPGAVDRELEGTVLGAVWDLVVGNPERLDADLRAAGPPSAPDLPPGVARRGDAGVQLAADVTLEPGVLLDTRQGPIRLAERVEVRAGCRLEGPLCVGAGSRLLGGSLSRLSAGPATYLRGEMEESVVLGHTNKAHDGFLGHAYLGRWVNLGALTTNSDLKNNYGTVRVGPPGSETDTGLLKLGCLIGDHVKTGIGVMLDTGTVLGAGCNVFGAAMPPKWLPPFSWGSGDRWTEYREDAFLATAATVMGRRGVPCGKAERAWLAAVWGAGRAAARAEGSVGSQAGGPVDPGAAGGEGSE